MPALFTTARKSRETLFRAMLARDFTVKGGLLLFPAGVTASLEVTLKSMVEVAGALESRMVCLERLVELAAENLYAEAGRSRTEDLLDAGPRFTAWWSVLKGKAGYQS